MKYLLLIITLLSTQSIAQTITCNAGGGDDQFEISNKVLIDTNEHIIAKEFSTGVFISKDEYGITTYTIHGNNIIMQFNDITKVYICESK